MPGERLPSLQLGAGPAPLEVRGCGGESGGRRRAPPQPASWASWAPHAVGGVRVSRAFPSLHLVRTQLISLLQFLQLKDKMVFSSFSSFFSTVRISAVR